jgi:hypothetical protein
MGMSTPNGPAPEDQKPEHKKPNLMPRVPVRIGSRLAAFLAAFCLLLAGLWITLPWLAQELIVPMLASALRTPHLSADIRRADFSGLDLGEVSLAPNSGIRTGAILVDWSLSGLLQGRVDRVRVLGLQILVREQDGKWEVPGLPVPEKSSASGSAPMFVPQVGELFVDGRISLEGQRLTLSAPLSVNGSLDEDGRLLLDTRTALAGQAMGLSLDAELDRNDFRLAFTLPPASVAALASLIPGLDSLSLGGTVASMTRVNISPDQKPEVAVNLRLDSMKGLFGSNALAQDGNTTMQLDWQDGVKLSLDPVRLNAPLPLVVTVSDIEADLDKNTYACSWGIALAALPGVEFSSAPLLSGRTEAMRGERGWDLRTRAELGAMHLNPIRTPSIKATLEPTPLTLDISTNATATRIDAGLALGRLRLTQGSTEANVSGLRLACNATSGSSGLNGTCSLAGALLEAKQPGLTLTSTRLEGQWSFDLGEQPSLNGIITASARVRAGDTAAVMSARLPMSWPQPATSPGSVDLDVNWNKKGLAKISSRIVQKLHGFSLDGTASLLPVTIRASLKGDMNLFRPEESWMELKAAQNLTLPGNLARFAPALGELSGSARLDATARLDMSRGVPMLPATLRLSGLSLNHTQSKTTLSNATAFLSFANLLTVRSDPDGRMTFDRLQLGTVILDQGDIHFQVEAPHSILVEGCSFRWAGGRVGSQSFRVNPGVEDYTVELYCDRVELTQALEQFGMTQAQGDGTANGRIPVRYKDGALTFDNGFLYSTPGEKGVLRVQGTEILTAGIPPGTPQYGQLDLATEALKDFAYEWAKINLHTQGRELVVSLQLDGKPSKPLPFTFDRDIGGFARVSASSPGSVFQGIRLDVNFRLPLDQLLQYRQLLELMKNGG